jgi:hypothetical protein
MADHSNSRKSSPVAVAVVAFLILLGMYAVSPGPVLWLLTQAGLQGHETVGKCVAVFYAPLIWLYEKFPMVHSVYDWYFSLFGVQ